jgi:hypothetical protein
MASVTQQMRYLQPLLKYAEKAMVLVLFMLISPFSQYL